MRYLRWVWLGVIFSAYSFAGIIDMKVTSSISRAQPVLLWCVKDTDSDMEKLAQLLQKTLSYTKQCKVSIDYFDTFPSKESLTRLKKEKGFHLVIVVRPYTDGYEWRLYNTVTQQLHGAHRYAKRGAELRAWAYNISDEIWPIMMQSDGFFSTKIAYTKKVPNKVPSKQVKHIYIADYDGSNAQLLIDTPTINVAPRWHYDRRNPMLFYSDFTAKNIRLMVMGLDKKPHVASNFDGLNMIPAFSQDGSKMVYCSSRGDGHCQLYYCQKDTIRNITNNSGNNISPSLTADGKKVFFCSDYQRPYPQLVSYDLEKNQMEWLTRGAHCETPRYSPKTNKIAYCRSVRGVMQLFTYDVATKRHIQLTRRGKNKQECCWSPCGNWLLYAEGDIGKASRIALINLHDKKQRFLTASTSDCGFPDWSPIYKEFPLF